MFLVPRPLLLASIASVALAACQCGPSQRACVSDADCSGTQICGGGGFCVSPDASVDGSVPDGGCSVQCASYQLCSGGACLSIYTDVRITSPSASAFVGASVGLAATLDVVKNVTRNDPQALSYAAKPASGATETGTLLLLGDGTFTGTWVPAQEGGYTLIASYPDAGLASAPIGVTVLKTPPVFQIQLPSPPRDGGPGVDPAPGFAASWHRDEVLPITIASSDPNVDLSSLLILVVGVGPNDAGVARPLLRGTLSSGCGQPFCATALLHLSEPMLEAFRGTLQLELLGADKAGNPGTANASVALTRWKWAYPVGAPLPNAPAVGHSGTLYLATASSILALRPDGTLLWSLDAGAVQTSLAVGGTDAGDVLYAALTLDGGPALAALDSTGALLTSCSATRGAASGGIALMQTTQLGQSTESAVAVFNDTPATTQLLALRRGAPGGSQCVASVVAPALVGGGTIASNGLSSVFYADDGGNLDSYTFNAGWPAAPTWSVGPYGAHALALWSGELIGGGGTSASGAFAQPPNGAPLLWSSGDGGTATAWSPVVADGGIVFYGDESGALTSIAVGTSAPLAATTLAAPLRKAGILGQGGFLYTSDESGTVTAWDTGLGLHWAFPGTAPSALSLDCSRDATGLKQSGLPGVLYAAASDGTLYAFVVDSIGLDLSAGWPKYQHDPRNTGNAATDLSEFKCF